MGQHYVDETYISGPVFPLEVGGTKIQLVLGESGTVYKFEGLERRPDVHMFQDGTVGITMSQRCTCHVPIQGGCHCVHTREGVFADEVYTFVDKEAEILVDEEGVAVVAPKGASWPDTEMEIEGNVRVFTHPNFPFNVVVGIHRPTAPVDMRKKAGRPVTAQLVDNFRF